MLKTKDRATLWVILASATLTVMAGAIIAPVLSLMGEGLGVDPGSARILITTHSLFVVLFSPFFGVLIDRIGPKKPLIIGLAVFGISGGTGLFINDYWLLLISRALLGIGVAAIFTSITVLIFNLYKQGAERNKVMGYRASSQSIGGVAWPLLGGFLGTYSWHYPFAIYFIGIPLCLLTMLFIPTTLQELTNSTDEKQITVLSLLWSTPTLLILYGLVFLGMVFLYSLVVFLPQFLTRFDLTSPLHISLFISGMGLVAGTVALMYGKISEKLSKKSIISIVLILWAIGFAILSRASTTWLVGLSITFFGAGQGMLMPTTQLWVGELVPASFRGRITSYLGSFGLLGQFLSPIILNPLASSLGLNNVFLVIGATCGFLTLLFLVFFRQKR
ncbi:MAG: MFS transporter [Dehalococcoidales bacterium]|nr:MAG: MFS transporter [Dehalococcoidales bacterium]